MENKVYISPTCQGQVGFLYDKNLSLQAKGLLAQMLTYSAQENLKVDVFANIHSISRESTYRLLRELKRKGYLRQEQKREGYRIAEGMIYDLYPNADGKIAKRLGE